MIALFSAGGSWDGGWSSGWEPRPGKSKGEKIILSSFHNTTKANLKTHQFVTWNTKSHRILRFFRKLCNIQQFLFFHLSIIDQQQNNNSLTNKVHKISTFIAPPVSFVKLIVLFCPDQITFTRFNENGPR